MGATADEVLLKIRAEGWKAAAKLVDDVNRKIKETEKTSRRPAGRDSWFSRLGDGLKGLPARWRAGEAGAAQFRRTIAGVGGDVARLSRGIAGTATSMAGIGGLVTAGGGAVMLGGFVKSGLELNASFEDARVSFGTLLGDMERGNRFIERLRTDISSKSPQRLTAVMGGAQNLLGQGMNEDQAVTTLGALDKAIIALGKGEEEYKLGARTLGQMWANGKASLEDVNQLAEGAGINVRKLLQEKLGLSGTQVADLGNQNVSSAAALWAITSGWEEQFSDAAKNAEQTWSVQVKQMVKDWEFFKRMTTEGLFKDLSKDVLPQLRKALTNANKIMARQDLTFEQKIRLSWESVKTDLGPLWSEIEDGVASLELDEKLREAAIKGLDLAVKGVVAAAPRVASAFWDAFTDMSMMGKLVTVAFLWNRLRLPFLPVAGKAAGLLWKAGKVPFGAAGRRLGATAGAQAAKRAAETAALQSMLWGDAIKAKAGPGMRKAGGALGRSLGFAMVAGIGIYLAAHADDLQDQLPDWLAPKGTKSTKTKDGKKTTFEDRLGAELRVRDAKAGHGTFTENDLKILASVRRQDKVPEPEIAKEMDELRRRTQYRPRATGGTVRPGEFTLIGERGPELMRLPSGTEITSNRQARAMGAGRQPGRIVERVKQPIVVPVVIDGREVARVVNTHNEIVELRR